MYNLKIKCFIMSIVVLGLSSCGGGGSSGGGTSGNNPAVSNSEIGNGVIVQSTESYALEEDISVVGKGGINSYNGLLIKKNIIQLKNNYIIKVSSGKSLSKLSDSSLSGNNQSGSMIASEEVEESTTVINEFSGNGIYSSEGDINNLENIGIISGEASGDRNIRSGNGIILSKGKFGTIVNIGEILGYTTGVLNTYSGRGVSAESLDILKNQGIISGKFVGDREGSYNIYSGNGINIENHNTYKNSSFINEILNEGIIKGVGVNQSINQNTNQSGNGIYLSGIYSEQNKEILIGNLNNQGLVSGQVSTLSNTQSGNGIYNEIINSGGKNYIRDINNMGTIKGFGYNVESTSDTGNGIIIKSYGYLKEATTEIKNIDNQGIIKGKNINGGLDKKYLVNIPLYIYEVDSNGEEKAVLITYYDKDKKEINYTTDEKAKGKMEIILDIIHNEETGKDEFIPQEEVYYLIEEDYKEVGLLSSKIVKNINSGNGLILYSRSEDTWQDPWSYSNSTLNNISNIGLIIGETISFKNQNSGNGIAVLTHGNEYFANINHIENSGIISGIVSGKENQNSGNGILVGVALEYGYERLTGKILIDKIENTGIIRGGIITDENSDAYGKDYTPYSGSGIYVNQGDINTINNFGIIQGSEHGIYADNIEILNNYGLIIGETPVVGNAGTNGAGTGVSGMTITINNDISGEQSLAIKQGADGKVVGDIHYELKNLNNSLLASDLYSSLSDTTGYILNGIDEAGVLKIDSDFTLNNSIINGYGVGIVLDGKHTFTGNNITINGGGKGELDRNKTAEVTDDEFKYLPVIKGSVYDDIINLDENSIINGDVELGAGNDALTIDNTVAINGNIYGGYQNDTLKIVKNDLEPDKIQRLNHSIKEVENINISTDTYLSLSSKVENLSRLTLEAGSLYLEIDPSVTSSEKITGHSLYGNNYKLTLNGGKLILDLNGAGRSSEVELGINNEVIDLTNIETNSNVLAVTSINNGSVRVDLKENLSQVVGLETEVNNYEKANAVYKSLVSSEEIGKLASVTIINPTEKRVSNTLDSVPLLNSLEKIYLSTPYAYTINTTKDSLKLFSENTYNNLEKPKIGSWTTNVKMLNTELENHDKDNQLYKTKVETTGGIVIGEYRLSTDKVIGISLGDVSQEMKYQDKSEFQGDGIYLGGYQKLYKNNLEIISGIGYQRMDLEGSRVYDVNGIIYITGDEYRTDAFNLYAEGRYVVEKGEGIKLIPNIKGSLYYLNQGNIEEEYEKDGLGIQVDKKDMFMGELSLGIDLVKEHYLGRSKLRHTLGVGASKTIEGRNEDLKGRIFGERNLGSEFLIEGVDFPNGEGKLSYNIEYIGEKGLGFVGKISYTYTTNKEENLEIILGIGYKF